MADTYVFSPSSTLGAGFMINSPTDTTILGSVTAPSISMAASINGVANPQSAPTGGNGIVDLGSNYMVVTSPTGTWSVVGTNGSTYTFNNLAYAATTGTVYTGPAAVAAAVQAACNGENWNGTTGLTSSAAVANKSIVSIGYIMTTSATTFGSDLSVPAGSLIARTTYVGDSNLQGFVNAQGYTAWLTGYNNPSLWNTNPANLWEYGDYTHQGFVDASGYTAWLTGYNNQGNVNLNMGGGGAGVALPAFAAAEGKGVGVVPEPSSIALVLAAVAAWGFARWRRR
jgi:hypothetical protein